MRYKNEILRHPHYKGRQFRQVNKTTAKKIYEQGKPVLLHPSNMIFMNVWQAPLEITKEEGYEFEARVNNFEFYMDPELGRYTHFFIDI